jgi:catechol 2,3-dioxygenase-like lactoylglutathione lyase family enzyme
MSDAQGRWPSGIAAVTLFVEDLQAAKRFYQDVFGRPIHFEDENSAVFKFGSTDRPWGIRTASFRDPGGHVWEIAH